MPYARVSIKNIDIPTQELIIANLSDAGFEGFEQLDTELIAYINEGDLNKLLLDEIAVTLGVHIDTETVQEENWNAQWEENFQPVIVDDFCTVRADFHNIAITTPYEIVITPKMSFGTGHHATTQLMIMQMRNINFACKQVLDFGTGTGILAVLAEMLGAKNTLAIDNDEWSYENSKENIARNNCQNVAIILGSLETVIDKQFDIILANINRNILLDYMPQLYACLKPGGILLMSGLLSEDEAVIGATADAAGFAFIKKQLLNNWIVLQFAKS